MLDADAGRCTGPWTLDAAGRWIGRWALDTMKNGAQDAGRALDMNPGRWIEPTHDAGR